MLSAGRVVSGGVGDPDPRRRDGQVVDCCPALGRHVTPGEELPLPLLCPLDGESHHGHGGSPGACLPGRPPGCFFHPAARPSLPPLLVGVKHRVELQHRKGDVRVS